MKNTCPFYIVFLVLKVLLIEICKIQPPDLVFLVAFIAFYISRYHFRHKFSFFKRDLSFLPILPYYKAWLLAVQLYYVLVPRSWDMKYFNFVNVSILCKANRPSFCLILSFSCTVCSVCYLGCICNGRKYVLAEWSITERNFFIYIFIVSCNSLIWLFSDIVSSNGFSGENLAIASMAPTIYFQMLQWPQFPGFGEYIFPQLHTWTALILSDDCTEGYCSSNTVIFDNFLVFNCPFSISNFLFLLPKYFSIFDCCNHHRLNAFKTPRMAYYCQRSLIISVNDAKYIQLLPIFWVLSRALHIASIIHS